MMNLRPPEAGRHECGESDFLSLPLARRRQRGQSLTNNTSPSYQKNLNLGMDHFEDLVGWFVAAFVARSIVLHGLVEHDEQALQLDGLAFKFGDKNT